jgi:Siphovirus Gp157.
MSFTGIQAVVDFYTMQEANLTNQMTDIMMAITRASGEIAGIAIDFRDQRNAVRNAYNRDSSAYKDAMDEIQDDYELKLAEITAWESELETKKDALEAEIKATSSYKDSFQQALKQNIQSDFKYGDTSTT